MHFVTPIIGRVYQCKIGNMPLAMVDLIANDLVEDDVNTIVLSPTMQRDIAQLLLDKGIVSVCSITTFDLVQWRQLDFTDEATLYSDRLILTQNQFIIEGANREFKREYVFYYKDDENDVYLAGGPPQQGASSGKISMGYAIIYRINGEYATFTHQSGRLSHYTNFNYGDGDTNPYGNTVKNGVIVGLPKPSATYTADQHITIENVGIDIPDIEITTDDPYDVYSGDGNIPGDSAISVPDLPLLSAVNTGLFGLFNPTESEMRALSDFMWTDITPGGTDITDILNEIAQAIKRSISNPLDYILGLSIIPSNGLSLGAYSNIRFGFISSGVSMRRLASQYYTVDCGEIYIEPLCGDTFLDYAPYAKLSIFLPYIGARELDPNDFVGRTIGVVYHCDAVTGSVTAFVTRDGSVMYEYSGNGSLNIPLSSESWASTLSAAMQIASTIAIGKSSLGSAGATQASANGAAQIASNPSLLSPQVQRSGSISGGAGVLGVQTPYIIRESVRFHSTNGFNTISGYPTYYYRRLGEMNGYTEVLNAHISNCTATSAEIDEIVNLLKGGVIL